MLVENLLDSTVIATFFWLDFGRFRSGVGEVFVAQVGGSGEEGWGFYRRGVA